MSSVPTKSWSIQLRELVNSPYVIIALTCVLGYVAYMKTRRQRGTYDDEDYENEGHRKLPTPLSGLCLNRKQLAKYHSQRPDKTYLLALDEVIYDVSSAEDIFGPGGKYASLPGTEISDFIKKQAVSEKRDFHSNYVEWEMMLEDFFQPAGELIDLDKDLLTDSVDKMESILEESSADENDSADKEQQLEPDREPAKEPEPKPEIPLPELPELNLGPADDAINSDCDSLRTAYDFPPDQDDRVDEQDDNDDEKEENEDEEDVADAKEEESFREVGQGDSNAGLGSNETLPDGTCNQTIWNDTDVTVVASV
ncbi:glutamic acid-rich protein [Drosophila teissieri]|uniref:glutamic acid-rich protein n=1 Tax=Drosophila teissieri TaxID=7243 RepID=UPI001CBA41EE|nr:glutamic acid-rich protein [Drosophila teissieri]